MKYILLAAILLPSVLIAQSPPPPQRFPVRQVQPGQAQTPTDALPDNYQVTLTITDKEGQPMEVSVVIASTRFNVSLGEQGLTLQGAATVEESGSIVIEYALGWTTSFPSANNQAEFRQSTTTGSVRLKLGEEVQIIKAGSRVARLSIKKLEASKPK